MFSNINACINELFNQCDRVVITASAPFNPKSKKINKVLADIRDSGDIQHAHSLLSVDVRASPGWMSPVDIYLNFMGEKSFLGSVGVVLGSWLRSQDWSGDYALINPQALHRWLDDLNASYVRPQH